MRCVFTEITRFPRADAIRPYARIFETVIFALIY